MIKIENLFVNNSFCVEFDDNNWTCFNCKIHVKQYDRSFLQQ